MEKQLTKSVDEQVQPQLSPIDDELDKEFTLTNKELFTLEEELRFCMKETQTNTQEIYDLLKERKELNKKIKDIIMFFSFAIVFIFGFMLIFWR